MLPLCVGLGVDGGDGESSDITDDEGSSLILERVIAPALAATLPDAEVEADDDDDVGLLLELPAPLARLVVFFLLEGTSSSESLRVKSTMSPEVVVEVGSLVEITEVCDTTGFGGSVVMTSMSSDITSTLCTTLLGDPSPDSFCFTLVLHEPSLCSCISVSSLDNFDASTSWK